MSDDLFSADPAHRPYVPLAECLRPRSLADVARPLSVRCVATRCPVQIFGFSYYSVEATHV